MIKPTKNRIFIKVEEQEKTIGGIILTDSEKQRFGEVLYVGDDITQVKKGDIAYFLSALSYRKVKVKDKDYLVCTEEDIACILK